MLKTRVITGTMLSVIIATVLIFSHIPWVLDIAIATLCVQSIYELYNAMNFRNHKWLYLISYAVAIVISFITLTNFVYVVAPLFVLAIVVFAVLCANVKEQKQIPAFVSIILAVIFSFFFKTMSHLRQMDNGVFLLGCAILISVITDIAAYFVGKTFGKHKLAPVISPKKTVEGSIGGTIVATVVLVLVAVILQKCGYFKMNIVLTISLFVLSSIIGQFGDLALSSIKRIVGIKDYGTLLPGHGGILDRFDSLLFVLPFTYLFCILFGNIFAVA